MFGDLTYNNKVVKPTLRPVEAIAGMYDTQTKNYEYAVDNYNKYQTALSSIPIDENTKHVVQGANEILTKELDGIAEKGDYENYGLSSKKLGVDLAGKHGLGAVQAYNEKVSARQAEISKLVDEGKISADRGRQYAQNDRMSSTKLAYDPELGRWEGGFKGGRQIVGQTDWGEKVVELVKGFKANTIPFKTEDGRTIVKDPGGSGYMIEGSNESVSEEEIYKFASTYLASNPHFQSELTEDIHFNMNSMLYDPETGTKRDMTVNDLKQSFNSNYLEAGKQMFGLGKGNLEDELEAKDIKPEQFYSALKQEEKMRMAAIPAMQKEGFNSLKLDYHKMGEGKFGSGNKDWESFYNGTVDTYNVQQTSSAEDQKNTASVYTTAKNNLNALNTKLTTLDHPTAIKEMQQQIAEQERVVAATADKQAQNINLVPEVKEEIKTLTSGMSTEIKGISISSAPLIDLIYRKIAGETIPDAELDKYVNDTGLKPYLDQLAATELRSARESPLQGKGNALENLRRVSKNQLSQKIGELAEQLVSKAEDGQIDYTKDYTAWNRPELAPGEERTNSISQLHNNVENMTKGRGGQYFTKFVHQGGLDLPTYLAETYDLEVGSEILWDEVKARPGIDVAPDRNGVSRPVIPMEIPIIQKGVKTVISVAPFVDEDSYEALYFEAVSEDRNKLMKKQEEVGLKTTEQNMLNRYNVALFDSGKFGKTYPTTKLLNGKDKDIIEVNWADGALPAKVEVNKSGSSSGFTYFLVDDSGKEIKYWAKDKNGREASVTKAELESDKYTAIGGDTPYDLRIIMGEFSANMNKLNAPTNLASPSINGKGSIAVTHNNPGNIKYGEFAQKYNTSEGKGATDGGKFAVFSTVEEGLEAQRDLLTSGNYANLSVDTAMKRWSNNGYGADIYPAIADKRMADLSSFELTELQRRQIMREDREMYRKIYGE